MPILMMFLIGLPVCPFQAPAADLAGELGHAIEHGVNLGNHIFAVDHDRLASRSAQGHVQDGATFGDIDLLATKHGFDARFQARLLGQLQEQPERLVRDPVFRVIEEDPGRLGSQSLAATWDRRRTDRGDACRLDLLAVSFQGLPGGTVASGCCSWCYPRLQMADSRLKFRIASDKMSSLYAITCSASVTIF